MTLMKWVWALGALLMTRAGIGLAVPTGGVLGRLFGSGGCTTCWMGVDGHFSIGALWLEGPG